jgi:hypothetical protein
MDSAIEVVNGLYVINKTYSFKFKNLSCISASAYITSNNTRHERVVSYIFRERGIESVANTFAVLINTIVIGGNRSRRDKFVLFLAPGKDKYEYSDAKKNRL